ncbi:hypothetical protein PTSG_02120 [Salpingoeca rosetta]|uniref:Uncharacterized protein n=1 Tax=Salpingoeca rosetta (strain ATCC 50818 / BSB-021) TaxID=946362 RepID=F2U196_SALR5|nr:uncharacterized protein PTSG_02120 [Salpingoeca rosetta]EGD81398.1 hypothetical protein PTSG_02120 [Salpingoeca rosetta]|eukprot:XP_004996602.1 hypothetical protein PTSG_02120 [Salpingoeca rosetta]
MDDELLAVGSCLEGMQEVVQRVTAAHGAILDLNEEIVVTTSTLRKFAQGLDLGAVPPSSKSS